MSASKLQLSDSGRLLHLLTLEDLPPKIIYSLFAAADKFAAHKPSPDARPLSGKLFVNIFLKAAPARAPPLKHRPDNWGRMWLTLTALRCPARQKAKPCAIRCLP